MMEMEKIRVQAAKIKAPARLDSKRTKSTFNMITLISEVNIFNSLIMSFMTRGISAYIDTFGNS